MRTGLIIFGIIFIVISGLLYFVPMQRISANTTTTDGDNVDTRTSSASLNVPVEWAYASGLIGVVLFILGLAISAPTKNIYTKSDSYKKVGSKEYIRDRDGNKHRIIRESD